MYLDNLKYIEQEYENRNLISLIAEYKRLDLFITHVLDVLNEDLDDDTDQRYHLVQQVICQKLLKEYDEHTSEFLDFRYWSNIGLPEN